MHLKKKLLSFLFVSALIFCVITIVLLNTSSNSSKASDTVINTNVAVTTDYTTDDNSNLFNYIQNNKDKINPSNPTNVLIDYMEENNIESISKTNAVD